MKVFKNKIFSAPLTETMDIGETIVSLNDANKHEGQYIVHQKEGEGSFPFKGGFNSFKLSIKFALSLENPTMVEDGYTIAKLDAASSLVIYYNQYEGEIDKLTGEIGTASEEAYKLGDTGISACIIVDNKVRDENAMYGLHSKLLDEFGRYLKSKERKDRFEAHPEPGTLSLQERMADVHHADVENFLYDRMNGIKY